MQPTMIFPVLRVEKHVLKYFPQSLEEFKKLPIDQRRDVFLKLAEHVENPTAGPISSYLYGGLILKRSGVCGGSTCIRDRRLPVWMMIELQQLGNSPEEILEMYPQLTREDLEAVSHYYKDNRIEILLEIVINDLV